MIDGGITGPGLAGIAGAAMTDAGTGGLTVDNCYPDEAPAEEAELAKIPIGDDHPATPDAVQDQTARTTRSRRRRT